MTYWIKAIGVLILVFSATFLSTTAVCDWICHVNGYYDQAAQEAVVLDE